MIRKNNRKEENMQKLQFVNIKTSNSIAFEDLVTVICTEFAKKNTWDLQLTYKDRMPYLQMNSARRRKISEKIIDALAV